jgi:hypothetical protein
MQRDARQVGLMRERERERERKGEAGEGPVSYCIEIKKKQQTFQKREEKPEVGSIAH